MIFIAGGDSDPSIDALTKHLAASERDHTCVLVGHASHPIITWDIGSDLLTIDGKELHPSGIFPTGIFFRHDVFTSLNDGRSESSQRAMNWYAALTGWTLAHPEVRTFNRASLTSNPSKPWMLILANKVGLFTPDTVISNALEYLDALNAEEQGYIAKPVAGGDYCYDLNEALDLCDRLDGRAATPALIQPMLVPPEIRIFHIAGQNFAFTVEADALDYRTTPKNTVTQVSVPKQEAAGLNRLMKHLGMNFGAADFKTCPQTNRLLFLELNSSPMFAAFDKVAKGSISEAMIRFLGAD